MLIRNGTSLGSNPCRFSGMNSILVTNLANWAKPGSRLNMYISEAGIDPLSGIPNGTEPPVSWVMAMQGGGLSAYNSIQGSGSISLTSLSLGKALAADLEGGGDITDATLSLVVQLAAALSGSGTISAASLQAIAGLVAALSGSGSISAAALSLLISLEADLVGSGDVSAALRGTLSLAADIVVTGSGLTTSNVGAAVWGAIAAANNDAGSMGEQMNNAGAGGNPWDTVIESGYTADEVMRILLAVAAGKTTVTSLGGGAATVTFRDQADTKDRVAVDMQDSDRQTVTLDPV